MEAPDEEVVPRKKHQRNVAEGRFVVPAHWPKWAVRCGAKNRSGKECRHWAVVGMPRCRYHGCGGDRNRQLGQLRYLAWIVLGAPRNDIMTAPAEHIVRLSLAMFAEYVFNEKNNVPLDSRIKAAMWLTEQGR